VEVLKATKCLNRGHSMFDDSTEIEKSLTAEMEMTAGVSRDSCQCFDSRMAAFLAILVTKLTVRGHKELQAAAVTIVAKLLPPAGNTWQIWAPLNNFSAAESKSGNVKSIFRERYGFRPNSGFVSHGLT